MIQYGEMPLSSRVWIYQADRKLTPAEAAEITGVAEAFSEEWTAHNHQLRASFRLFYDQFLVFLVDEDHELPSGCSIDKSVNLVKQLESRYGISLLNRMVFAYKEGEAVRTCSRQEFESLAAAGRIGDDTIVFNNLVATKGELESNWQIPMSNSWHRQLVNS